MPQATKLVLEQASYSTIVLHSKDHAGLGVAYDRISPQNSLNSPIQRYGSIS